MGFAQKYVGGDISLLTKYETNGAQYYDLNGNSITDMLTYLKGQGMNSMRVRLFVDPTNATRAEKGQGVCQDLEYVKALGKKIKDAGLSFMLDFHYSDTWADPGKQWTPKAWESLTDEELYTKIYDYTKDCLQQLKAAGATPDFIQTGNEISYGMVWGKAIIASDSYDESTGKGKTTYTTNSTHKTCYSTSSASNWTRFFTLLKQAGKACREVCPNAKIILHSERTPKPNVLQDYYQRMKDNQIDYDIIGLSYYPYHHGFLNVLNTALTNLETNFDKDIMIVETGYYYVWQPSDVTYNYASTYPITPAGQKSFTTDLIALLKQHSKVKGLYWWMMEACENGLNWSTKRVTDGWYNASLFNDSNTSDTGYPAGKAMPAIAELKNFLDGQTGINNVQSSMLKGQRDTRYTLDGRQLTGAPNRKGLYLSEGKKIVVK